MNDKPSAARRLTLGKAIPMLLALTFVAELALRCIPLEDFAFRSHEALLDPDPRREGPYLPGRSYRNERTYGDLAGLGNLPALRQYRRETFTTDAWGFRNPPSSRPEAPAAILIGDSFGVATGVEDRETLPAALGRLWGRGVYNASGMRKGDEAERIRAIARRLGIRGGLVIHEFLERQDVPVPPSAKPPEPSPDAGRAFSDLLKRVWATSRLRILAERIDRRVQDGRIVPNSYRSEVVLERLRNGAEILFSPIEIEVWRHRRSVDASHWRRLQAEIAKDGLRLVVLLVPVKYDVYGPLLEPPASQSTPGADHLERLEASLVDAGVPVVNLKAVFRELAREGLPRGRYLYWRDDTHWNALGLEIAAEELVRAIPDPASPR